MQHRVILPWGPCMNQDSYMRGTKDGISYCLINIDFFLFFFAAGKTSSTTVAPNEKKLSIHKGR